MSIERFIQYVLGIALVIIVIFVLIWVVNELDEESVDAAAAQVVAWGRG